MPGSARAAASIPRESYMRMAFGGVKRGSTSDRAEAAISAYRGRSLRQNFGAGGPEGVCELGGALQ